MEDSILNGLSSSLSFSPSNLVSPSIDMKERLCLEVERLGLSTLIMGSRGFGATNKSSKGRMGSVSEYSVHHCACPVVVVRFPDEKDGEDEKNGSGNLVDDELHTVPEVAEEGGDKDEYHDASDKQQQQQQG